MPMIAFVNVLYSARNDLAISLFCIYSLEDQNQKPFFSVSESHLIWTQIEIGLHEGERWVIQGTIEFFRRY
jgi:hypothetical protein